MLLGAVLSLLLQPSLAELARHSSIIFSGRVERSQAATANLPASNETSVVRVDEVLWQPVSLARLSGRQVTVRFHDGQPPAAGEPVLFFTTLYAAGKSIGLDAVGVVRDLPLETARASLAKARETILDQDITARLATSALVVAGVVRSVRRPDIRDSDRVSEHDPEWASADVVVESVLKGAPAQKKVTVFFASSRDGLYTQWAKLREGDRVVVIAQRSDPRLRIAFERSRLKPEGPFVIDRVDVQPPEQLERVRRLSR